MLIESKVAGLNLGFFGEESAVSIAAIKVVTKATPTIVFASTSTVPINVLAATAAVVTETSRSQSIDVAPLVETTSMAATATAIAVADTLDTTSTASVTVATAIATASSAIKAVRPPTTKIAIIIGASAGGLLIFLAIIATIIYRRPKKKQYNIRRLKSVVPSFRETQTSFYSTDVDLPFQLGSPVRQQPILTNPPRLRSMVPEQSRFSEGTIASSGVQSYRHSEDHIISQYMNPETDRASKLWRRLFR